jgi:hypothetical protein
MHFGGMERQLLSGVTGGGRDVFRMPGLNDHRQFHGTTQNGGDDRRASKRNE